MRALCLSFTALLLPLSATTQAFTSTAGELVEACQSAESGDSALTRRTACVAFVVGVVYGFSAAEEHLRIVNELQDRPKLFCLDDSWTGDRGFEIFLQWAKEHPERSRNQPASVVLWAHREAYPCRLQ